MAPPPLSLARFLPYRLSVAANLVSDVIAGAYRALFGLKVPEWRLIAVLAESGAMTQQAIGQRTRMDKMTVSRAAATLVGRRLIARGPNEGDARSHMLSLTHAGDALYAEVAPKALELERSLFAGFTPAELGQLREMLERIETAALGVVPAVADRPKESR